jgi:hypothetical protein
MVDETQTEQDRRNSDHDGTTKDKAEAERQAKVRAEANRADGIVEYDEKQDPGGRNTRTRIDHARKKSPVYLVDIKENPGVPGSLLVEATAPDGTVESATFTGPRASHRAMKYIEAVDNFEKRPPAEYPKYVRRGGVEHLLLDAKHEKQIGPPSDADKTADEAQRKAAEDVHGRHAAFEEAQARATAKPTPVSIGPRPERIADGEDDTAYAERLAKWQDQRRGVIGDATSEQQPAVEAVQFGGQPVAEHANTGFQTDSTKYPSVKGEVAGEHYQPVDNVRSPDGLHVGGPLPSGRRFAPRPNREAGESDEAYEGRLAEWRQQWRDAGKGDDAPEETADSFASPQSIEAQRVRDIAARRREPSIENTRGSEG